MTNYANDPINRTARLNEELAQILKFLNSILEQVLNAKIDFTFNGMKRQEKYQEFQLPRGLDMALVKPSENNFINVKKPDFIDKLLGGEEQYKRKIWEAKNRYNIALQEYNRQVDERNNQILRLRAQYEKDKGEFEIAQQQRNKMVDELEIAYKNGSPDAVKRYCGIILNSSPYPKEFPHKFRITNSLDSGR